MISVEYAARQLKGVIDISFNGNDADNALDNTIDDVFNSFWAIAFALGPLFLIAAAARQASLELQPSEAPALAYSPLLVFYGVQVFSSVTVWVASLATLVMTARKLDAGKRAASAIVGFNWMNLLTLLFACVPSLALLISGNAPAFAVLLLPVAGVNIFILWRMLRATLLMSVNITVALFFLLLLIEIITGAVIMEIANAFVQAPGG